MNAHVLAPQGRIEIKAEGRAESMHALARRIYDDCGFDDKIAIDLLVSAAKTRPALAAAMIYAQAVRLIQEVRIADNATLNRGGRIETDSPRAAAMREAMTREAAPGFYDTLRAQHAHGNRASKETLFDKRYSIDGKSFRLGDATMAQLDVICGEKRGRISSEYRDMKWLERIRARGTRDTQRVSDVITLKEAQKLKRDADSLPV